MCRFKRTFTTHRGREYEINLPGKYEVCSACQGSGTELYGSMKGYAYTQDELAEDPDFASDMMAGHYDVQCSHCHGLRVEAVPLEENLSPHQRRLLTLFYAYEDRLEEMRQADRKTRWAESEIPPHERY